MIVRYQDAGDHPADPVEFVRDFEPRVIIRVGLTGEEPELARVIHRHLRFPGLIIKGYQ